MTTSTYIFDSALVLLVLFQIKERRMTTRLLVQPLVILGAAVATYFQTISTTGNDLLLIAAFGLIGATIGTASGLSAIMRRGADGVTTRAGWWSGFFWVLGMGSRFAFAVWVAHGGAASIASFSAQNSITGAGVWTDALLLMAVCEIVGRTLVQGARWRRLAGVPVLSFA